MEELQIFNDLEKEVNNAEGILAEWSKNYYQEGTKRRYLNAREIDMK